MSNREALTSGATATAGFPTRAIHHGYDVADYGNALQLPNFLTATYGFSSVEANELVAPTGAPLYGREHNPTTQILERRLANLDAAINTRMRLIYFETPVNPPAAILDIAAIADRAHARGVKVAVDWWRAWTKILCTCRSVWRMLRI